MNWPSVARFVTKTRAAASMARSEVSLQPLGAQSSTYRRRAKHRRMRSPNAQSRYRAKSFKSFDNGWQFRTDAFSIPARRACSIPGPSRPPIDLLRPFPADEMEAFEVSTDVGNVKNNSPELLNSK